MTDYVLNRASVAVPFADVTSARTDLSEMLRGLALLDSEAETLPAFRCYCDPWLIPIASTDGREWSMGEVAHSLYETEDYDLAAYFDSLSRMVPADSDVGEDLAQTLLNFEIEKAVAGHEGCFERAQEAAADLAICAVSSSLLASVLGLNVWCFDQLAFNSGGHDFVVEHVATPAHAMRIQQRRTQGIRTQLTARAFWALKDRAFPNLRFGIDVEAQIGAFDAGLLPLLFRRLADLDRRVALWREAGAFPETLPPITPESEETMRQYGPARNFRNAQGRNQTFEDHIWVDSLHRIHLFRHADVKLIEIGYVGRHLPTIRHPT